MNDFDEAIKAISQEKTVHPGDRNPAHLPKNHPIRFVLEHAANTSDIRKDGTRAEFDYTSVLEREGYGDYAGLVTDAVTKIRERARAGNNGEARRLADNYVANIAANHLTADERITR